MRRRPLRKISCHPFLKIFVNLVSSVCGFISTCINVSSLVTEPQYLGEDIIKNVWGVEGGVCAEEWECEESQGGGLSGWRKAKSSSRLVVSLGSLWNTEPVITDKPHLSSSLTGITQVSVCCYLFNGNSSTDLTQLPTQRKTTVKCIHLVTLLPYQHFDAQQT